MSANFEITTTNPLHNRIVTAVMDRYRFSKQKMGNYITAWNNADKMSRAYIKETEVDAQRRLNRDNGFADYTTIDMPLSYAMLLSAHTYWTSVFLGRNPVFQFMGRHGEGQQNVLALEALIDYQVQVGEMMVPFYIWLYDKGKYGRGILGLYWDETYANVAEIIEEPVTVLGFETGKTRKRKRTRRMPGYKGNKVYNVRPHDFFPDPRVPLARLQEGEFCAVYTEISWNLLLSGEADGKYFNLKELKKYRSSPQSDRVAGDITTDLPDINTTLADLTYSQDFVPLIEMYIDLVPSEWGLGAGKLPEKWVFTLADQKILIGARPMGALHDRFPFAVQEYEIEGYDVAKRSMLEINKPLNDVITWLVNSHFYNTRKSMNDQFVVDPSRIVMSDLTDPNPGKLLRLKPSAYGTDVNTVVSQLQVADVTRNNLQDVQLISNMLQRLNGINDNMQGVITPGGRKTATEVRSSGTSGVGRLKTISEYNSVLGWAPLSQMMVQNTQQYYDMERTFRVTGDIMKGQQFVEVAPETILGYYDFVSVDGAMPLDKFAMAALWKDLLGQMRQIPQLAMEFDISKIFSYVAQLSGLRNINQFRINVVPDEQLQRDVQAGNTIPLGGSNGSGSSGAGGNPPDGAGGLPGAPVIPGVGPAA